MILTTSTRNEALVEKARKLSKKYGIEYHARGERSLSCFFKNVDPQVFVVNHSRGLSYYEPEKNEAFYHPNMAFLRIENLRRGEPDGFVSACGLEPGMTFLDTTLGLASDALVAAYVTGENGQVTGVEKSRPIHILVSEGMDFYGEQSPWMYPLTTRLQLHHADNLDFLRSCGDKSYDVVYFDFMFQRPVLQSHGLDVIRSYAAYDTITPDHIAEARRVAGHRIVVKTDAIGKRLLAEMGFCCLKKNSRHITYMGYSNG